MTTLPGMMAYTMRYQEELRDPAEYFRDIKKVAVNEDSLELAESLIKKKTAKFDPGKFKDGYEAALKELVEAKINHAPIPKDEVSHSEARQCDQPDGCAAQERQRRRGFGAKEEACFGEERPEKGPLSGEVLGESVNHGRQKAEVGLT